MTIPSLYAPVGPIGVLEYLAESKLLESYVLVLAHEVLDAPQRYRELFENFEGVVILDNSVIELGQAMPPAHIAEAADIVGAHVVVLPDVLRDGAATFQASIAAQNRIRLAGYAGEFMAVPQGHDYPSICWCAQQLAVEVKPQWWGVPRWITNVLGSREPVVQFLGGGYYNVEPINTRIHLLGMSEKLEDDIRCARMRAVTGIDSANPLIAALNGQVFFKHPYVHLNGDEKKQYWKLHYKTEMGAYLHWRGDSAQVEMKPIAVDAGALVRINANIRNFRNAINGKDIISYT